MTFHSRTRCLRARRRFVPILTVLSLISVALVAAPAASASVPVAHGPDFPPPGGATFSESGNAPDPGGITFNYSGFDQSAFSQIAWGLDGSPVYVSMEGAVAPADYLTYNAAQSDLAAGVLVWTGSTSVTGLNYSGPVATALRVTLTDAFAAPAPFLDQAALPVAGVFDATLPPAVGTIGGVAPFPSDGAGNLELHANLQFLAGIGTPTQAASTFFDAVHHVSPSTSVLSSVDAGSYWTSAATASLVPSATDFGSEPVGGTSATVVHAVLTSTGPGDLHLDGTSPVTLSGGQASDFSIVDSTCDPGAILPQDATCAFDVTFAPQATGPRGTTVLVKDNALDSPQSFAVTGVGTPPAATVTPPAIDYGQVPVGSTVQSTVTVTSSNDGTLHLDGAQPFTFTGTDPGDFAVAPGGTCVAGSAVPGGSSCTVQVAFTPGAAGGRSGTLQVHDDATDSPQTVSLAGTGTVPLLEFSPTGPMDFGSQLVGTTSAPRTLEVINNGQAPLTITDVAFTGDTTQFSLQPGPSCAGPIAPGSSCSATVDFAPTSPGAKSMTLTLTDNAEGSPHSYVMTGTGTQIDATFAPDLSFGTVAVGATATRTATLTNTGGGTLHVSSVLIGGAQAGDFSIAGGTCPAAPFTLAVAHSCTVSVRFAPVATGIRTATLTVVDDAVSGPNQSVALSGKAVTRADLSVSIAGAPSPAQAGSAITYTIAVRNGGPSTAAKVHLVDTLPSFTTFVSLSAPGWTCTAPAVGATGTVVCNRSSLLAHKTVSLVLVVKLYYAGNTTVSDTVSVSAATTDPEPANNSATITLPVKSTSTLRADLSVSLAAAPSPARVGQPLVYTITVHNGGPDAASGVELTDALPAFTTFHSVTASGWSCSTPAVGSAGTLVCRRSSLAAHGTVRVTLTVDVYGGGRSTISDTASVASRTRDAYPANNSATLTLEVKP